MAPRSEVSGQNQQRRHGGSFEGGGLGALSSSPGSSSSKHSLSTRGIRDWPLTPAALEDSFAESDGLVERQSDTDNLGAGVRIDHCVCFFIPACAARFARTAPRATTAVVVGVVVFAFIIFSPVRFALFDDDDFCFGTGVLPLRF